MNDYSRSEYLRALLNQKKNLNANSNSLVNPSVPQANNIGDLAALDTSFSGVSSSTMPETNVQEQDDRNWWQRTLDTASEFVSNINEGVLGFVDGIVDTGGYIYGAISGDHKGAQDFMNYDWEAQALNVLNQLDVNNVLTGDVFTENYWQDWADTGSAAASRENINQLHQNSWTSELGAEGQNIYNSITQGIGSALPSVALGIATGGMSLGAQTFITMGTMGTSAFGNAASEALNDGATYGQAAIYGGVSAAIETLTEIGSDLVGKLAGKAISSLTINGVKLGAKEAIKAATQQGFKTIAKETIQGMLSEGLEEVVSSALNPAAKMIYKGTEALEEYKSPEFYTELITSFVGGAVGALAGSGVQKVHLTKTYSKAGLDCLNSFNLANELQQEYNGHVAKGGNVTELSQEYGALYSEQIQNGIKQLEQLQKTNPKAYEKVVQALNGTNAKTTSQETYDQAIKNLQELAEGTMLQRYAKDISSRIGVDVNVVEDSLLQSAEAFEQATGIKLTEVERQQFDNYNATKKGLMINGKTYISNKYENSINQMIMHEAVSHGYMDSNKELRDSFLKSLKTNKEFRTKLESIKDETIAAYGLNKTQVTNMLNATETISSEQMAKFMEFLYSDGNISSALNSLNKSKLRSMLTRAISYLKTKGDSTKQARTELERILSKIKLDKEYLANSGLKFSIKTDSEGEYIYADSTELGIREELERKKYDKSFIKQYLHDHLLYLINETGILSEQYIDGHEILFTTTSEPGFFSTADEIAYSESTRNLSPTKIYGKALSIDELTNIFKIAKHLKTEPPKTARTVATHFYEFRYVIKIGDENRTYYPSLVLKEYYDGRYQLYDILMKTNKGASANTDATQKVSSAEQYAPSNSSISETNQNINTKNEKSKSIAESTSSTPTITHTIPTYNDFFTKDGKLSADWIKHGARANLGNVVSVNDSRAIVDVALNTILSRFNIASDIKVSKINDIVRTFFEQYNIHDGETLRSKAYNQLLDNLLEATVTIKDTKQKLQLKDLIIEKDISQFKKDFTSYIEKTVANYGNPTLLQKTFDEFNRKIENLKQKISEKVKEIPNSDYFSKDGKINAVWVKQGARGNYGKTFDLNDSKFIVEVALDTLHRKFAVDNEMSMENIDEVARKFFEKYNVSDGQVYRSKAFKQLLDDLLASNVVIKGVNRKKPMNRKMPLSAFLSSNIAVSNYTSISEFKEEFTALIQDMVENYGKPTKLQKAYDTFNAKLEEIKTNALATVENVKLAYKSVKIAEKITKKYADHKVKSYLGVLFPELIFIRDLAKGIKASSSLEGISGSSIDHIIKHFDDIDYKEGSEALELLGLEFNQEWFDMVNHFKNKLVLKDGNLVSKNRRLTLEENKMINKFLKELQDILKKRITKEQIEMRKRHSKGTTEINIVASTINVNKKASKIGKEFDTFSSPDVRLRRIYGVDSEVVKICYDDLLHAYYVAQGTAQGFVNKYLELEKKHKVKNQLSKKTEIKLGNDTYKLQNDLLVDIYTHSLATENRKVLLSNGYEFQYNGRNVSIKFTEEMLNSIESKLSNELKDFAKDVLDYYNTELKDYAKAHGIEVLENEIYYPLSRSDVATTEAKTVAQKFRALNPDTLPINQQRKDTNVKKQLQGMGIGERLASYASQVSRIGEMTEAMDNYSTFLNTKVKDKGNLVSRNALMSRVDGEWSKWKQYIEYQLLGIPIENKLNDSTMMGNLVASTLGWNISTLLKQTASVPTILTEVHFSSWLKGLSGIKNVAGVKTYKGEMNYKEFKQFLMESSPLLNKRFSTHEVAHSHLLTERLSAISKFFMRPIEGMDEAVVLTFCYQTALYEAQLEGAGAVGTEENHKRAMQILEKIVLNTQSNAVAPKMSMARSGYAGYRKKVFSYFTSDLNNIINKISECVTSLQTAKRNVQAIEEKITKDQQELDALLPTIPDDIDKQIEEKKLELETLSGEERKVVKDELKALEDMLVTKDNLELELENLKDLLERNKVYADGDRKLKEVFKLLGVLIMKGLMVSGIVQLVDRLYGRRGWTEDTSKEFFLDLFFESTLNNLPYVQTIVNAWDYDQDISSFELTGINDSLSVAKDIANQVANGKVNVAALAVSLLTIGGQFTGIPFKNIYNLVFGAWKNIDESGYSVDAYLKGYSDSYISQQYKAAIEGNRNNQAEGYLDILMKNNKVSTTSTTVSKELMSLTKDGYSVLPKNYMLGYTDENGKQVKLTEEQILQFRKAYNESNKAVEGLLKVTEYKKLTQEEKAQQIKKIYDIYYSYARAKTLKQDKADNKLATLLLYTNGGYNISKFTNVLNTISSIKESKTKSRKELVIEYVNKLNGYSKQEKLLILHLAGYKTNEQNVNSLSSHLRQNGMTIQDVNKYLGVE